MNPIEINIIFNTFSLTNTKNLIRSINTQLNAFSNSGYCISVTILYKNQSADFENIVSDFCNQSLHINFISNSNILLLEEKYHTFIKDANCSLIADSIQRGRIQQQIYIIENYLQFQNTIIWQVDDDMLFNSCTIENNQLYLKNNIDYFGILVDLYLNNERKIDAIIAKSNYTPPIPALLYTLNQLTDILLNKYVQAEVIENENYHDYYFSSAEQGNYNIKLHEGESTSLLIKRILNGQPVTRPVLHKLNSDIKLEPCFLRGGNFIVFNTAMFLNVPHLGFVFNDNEPARRSDMLHASLSLDMGYTIVENQELVLVHNRSFEEYSFEKNIANYYNDIIGSLVLIKLHKGIHEVNERISFHKMHINNIINLFDKFNLVEEHKIEYELLLKIKQQIESLTWEHLQPKYELFKKKYCKIKSKEKVCK